MNTFDLNIPTRTVFGSGALNSLHAQPLPGKKAAIIISRGKSTRANGYLSRTEDQLHQAGVETVVFDQVGANPTKDTVMSGGAFVRDNGCDFVVALGGGSCIDAAKAIAMISQNEGDYWDYIQSGTGKSKPIANDPLPIIAIPTTAGTGSETAPGAVVTNEETNEKIGLRHPKAFPVIAIVDPELTLSVPPRFTAYQGFDALFHSTEGFISNGVNPMSDIYALGAIENVSRYLARAVNDGNDLEAREHVMLGANLSGVVMCVGKCTSEHSLEHAMSAIHHSLPHGAGLILISKAYYTHFINQHVCDDRFIAMAKAMGKEDASDPMDFITMLDRLMKDCHVDDLKLSDFDITPDEFETLAINAKETMGGLFLCDRSQLSTEDCVAIFAASNQ